VNVRGATAADITAALVSGDISAKEIVEQTLSTIEAVNGDVNAFPWVRRDGARADGAACDERLARARPPRALEGVPFTVKDLCAIEDGPTQMGSRAFEGHRFGFDQTVVKRLRAAGAILVANTASSEFGNRPTCENDLYGITRNPWNHAHTTGGSSGGAGASAALGVAPLNQGSDSGGSVRIPSSCCGVYGLKPSRHRITLGPHLGDDWAGFTVYGPLTRTVADAALFLDVTAGPMAGDAGWAPPPSRPFSAALTESRRCRIAITTERDGESVDADTKAAVRATGDLLSNLGHDVFEGAPALLPLEEGFLMGSTVGIGAMDLSEQQLDLLEPRTRLIFDVSKTVPATQYLIVIERMQRACRTAMRFFDDVDAMITPTLSRPAPPVGVIGADIEHAWEDYRNWLCWTWPFNVTGQPAANVPAGFNADGLPLGVQVVGRPTDEHTVLMLSAQLEQARPWAQTRPW
jgi:amidase